jgi:L-amino acid N-acyltransferase YncA
MIIIQKSYGGNAMNRDIKIRAASEEDAEGLLRIYAPYVTKTAITFEYDVPDAEEFRSRIRQTLENYPYIVAEKNGLLLGYAYAGPFSKRTAYQWSVETSIYVDENRKREGIGSTLYSSLEKCLTEQGILNVNACIAYPVVPDKYLTLDSVRFHDKMGYRMVGEFHECGYKFGRWYDMVWMEKHLGRHLIKQPPIKRFKDVIEQCLPDY